MYFKVERDGGGATLHRDDEIVRLCQQGRQEGFSRLLQAYQGRVYRRAYSFLRNREDALDATQDVFLKVLPAIGRFRAGSPLWPWLRRITTNICLNRLRAASSRPETLEWEAAGDRLEAGRAASDPEAAAELTWDREALDRALAQLPAAQRIVVVLRHEEDLTYEEIAEVTNLPLGTVKTHLFRARKALREALRNEVIP